MNTDIQSPTKLSNLDVIIEWLKEDESIENLSDKQKELVIRYSFADDIIRSRKHWTDEQFIRAIRWKYGVSRVTAHNDLKYARQIFGSNFLEDKNYWKMYLVNEAKEGIRRVFAATKFDPKAHKGYLDLIKEISGANISDDHKALAESLKPSVNVLVINTTNNQQYHLHLDSLDSNDPQVIEMIHKEILDDNKLELPSHEDSGPPAKED